MPCDYIRPKTKAEVIEEAQEGIAAGRLKIVKNIYTGKIEIEGMPEISKNDMKDSCILNGMVSGKIDTRVAAALSAANVTVEEIKAGHRH